MLGHLDGKKTGPGPRVQEPDPVHKGRQAELPEGEGLGAGVGEDGGGSGVCVLLFFSFFSSLLPLITC